MNKKINQKFEVRVARLFSLLFLTSFFAFSCEKELPLEKIDQVQTAEITNPETNTNKSAGSLVDYVLIDALTKDLANTHNEALDHIYLSINLTQNKLNKNSLKGKVNSSAIDFFQQQEEYIVGKMISAFNYNAQEFTTAFNTGEEPFSSLWMSYADNNLTENQKFHLTELDVRITTACETIKNAFDPNPACCPDRTCRVQCDKFEILRSEIEEFKQDLIIANVCEEDALILFTAANISEASLSYWFHRVAAWSDLLNDITGDNKAVDWAEVGKADAAGGVATLAAVGAVAVFAGPPGWAATGGATLGGAVGASVYEFLIQWWG